MQNALHYATLDILFCPPNGFLNWVFWAVCLNLIILLNAYWCFAVLYKLGLGGTTKIRVHGASCSRNQRLWQRNVSWRKDDVLDLCSAAFAGSSSPLLTQEVGWSHFLVSRHNGEGGFPLSSQDRLNQGVKPEKRAPTFHAIVIFEANPQKPRCWSFWGTFVLCLQQQTSPGSVPPCFGAAWWLLSSKCTRGQGKWDSKWEFIGRGGTGRPCLKGVCKPQH